MFELYTLDFYKKHITNPYSDKNNILFGTYDNIKFSPIKTYLDAEKMISISQYNVLDRMARENREPDYPTSMILLYSLEENKDLEKKLWELDLESEKNVDFLSVILFKSQNYRGNLSCLSKEIHKIVTETKKLKDMKISCFGTFGMYDMCVIVRSSSIEKVVGFVDLLYDIDDGEAIKTSYTIVNYIGRSRKCLIMDNKRRCDYIANIQITCTCKRARKNILLKLREALGSNFNKVVSYAVFGEYDLCIHIPANILVLKLYQQDGIFNSYSVFYKENIIQSCTRISKKEEVIEEFEKDYIEKNNNNSCDYDIKNENVHNKIIGKFKDLIDNKELKNLALKRILQLAYVDFCKAYFVSPKSCAIMDLECQFISTIDCIGQILNKEYEKEYEDAGYKAVYDAAYNLAEMLSKKIYTVNQENSYSIVEPYSYLYNTGILQDIIHMYESFIKSLLAVIYAHCSIKQSELIPVVSVDAAVNIPISDLFIYNENKHGGKNSKQNSDQLRIISIKLPLDVILRPEIYLPLLVHEVMHYLCPYDRILRNEIGLKLYMKHYFFLMSSAIFKSKDYSDNDMIRYIRLWFDKNFDSIINRLKASENSQLDFESKSLTFSSQVENSFDASFSKYGGDGGINSELFKIYKQFVMDFQKENKIAICNINDLRGIIASYGKNKNCISEIKDISDGLKELICDIFMCEFFGLDEVSYFSLIIISILNQDIKHDRLISAGIRFGGIIRWEFEHNNFDINDFGEEIIKMVGNINPIYQNRENDIRCIFEMLNRCISLFFERFSYYTSEINDYIKCYNIGSYSESSSILDNDPNILLKKFAMVLETVHNNFDEFKTCVTTDNEYTLENAINLIQLLPNDLSLNDLDSFYKKCQTTKCENCSNKDDKYVLKEETIAYGENENDFDDLTTIYIDGKGIESAIRLAKIKLMDNDSSNDYLWYRGQINASWGVAPALFRNCGNDFRNKLIDAYELFRAQACESLEIHTNIDSDSDWIACMQHYFVPTHFLDWSEQPLTSLYFALENFFDFPCKYYKKSVPECDNNRMKENCLSDAALFVLNPNRMNRILCGLNGVPNISIPRNEVMYKDYVLPNRGDCGTVEVKTSRDFFSQPSSENGCWKYMPIAVITSQLNSRIKAQKGHFVAYNLQVNYPLYTTDGDGKVECQSTSICDLYSIQKELKNICRNNGIIFKPFMAKIIIPQTIKEEVYSTLKAYGINKSSFYPELMHIGSDVSKIVF